jgi:hypothetical protein
MERDTIYNEVPKKGLLVRDIIIELKDKRKAEWQA